MSKPKRNAKPLIYMFIVLGVIFGAVIAAYSLAGSAYAGGWEVQNSLNKVIIEDKAYTFGGEHSTTKDIDGDFALGKVHALSDNPDITVKSSYPYYITPSSRGTGWVESAQPYVLDTYDRDWDSGFTRYRHYTMAYDVTIQTNAESYYKQQYIPLVQEGYVDYGYGYEENDVYVTARIDFGVHPWVPSGSVDDYSIINGWAGVMSASVIGLESGLVQSGAEENYGHVIQNLDSVGDALNMYTATGQEQETNFKDPNAIAGVPTEIAIESHAQLGAGAKYTSDLLGHWNSLAVRNVFVKYTVRVDVVTTLVYELEAGAQDPEKPPVEDNTGYEPEITPWKNFLEFMEGEGIYIIIFLVVAIVVVVVVIYVVRPILTMKQTAQRVRYRGG